MKTWVNKWLFALASRAWRRHPNVNSYAEIYSHHVNINKKHSIQNKNFFLFKTTKLFPSLEGLNSSLAQPAGELWPLAKLAKVTFCGTWIFAQFLIFEPEWWLQIC